MATKTRILHPKLQRSDGGEEISLPALLAPCLKSRTLLSTFQRISSANLRARKKKNATTNFYGLWLEILVFMACTRFQFISIYFPFNSTFNKTTEASLYSSLYSLISCSAENDTQIIRSHFGGAWPSVIKADRDICCLFRGTF